MLTRPCSPHRSAASIRRVFLQPQRSSSPRAAHPRLFGFSRIRHRAAIRCSAFVRPSGCALVSLPSFSNQSCNRRDEAVRHDHHCLVASAERCLIFGDGFFFRLFLIVLQYLSYSLFVPSGGVMLLFHRPFFL